MGKFHSRRIRVLKGHQATNTQGFAGLGLINLKHQLWRQNLEICLAKNQCARQALVSLERCREQERQREQEQKSKTNLRAVANLVGDLADVNNGRMQIALEYCCETMFIISIT